MLCPLPGKCIHDEFIRTGVHFCSAPRCPHARLVRMALGEQIQAICRKKQRTEAEEIHLEFIDNDTMKLDSDTFARVKPQG